MLLFQKLSPKKPLPFRFLLPLIHTLILNQLRKLQIHLWHLAKEVVIQLLDPSHYQAVAVLTILGGPLSGLMSRAGARP